VPVSVGDKHQWMYFGEWHRLGGSINEASPLALALALTLP